MIGERRRGRRIYVVYMHHFEGVPFYIGCGTANRPMASGGERENVWNEKVDSLPYYDIRVLYKSHSKASALKLEADLIRKHRDTLVNGRGGHTDAYIQKCAEEERAA